MGSPYLVEWFAFGDRDNLAVYIALYRKKGFAALPFGERNERV